MGRVANHLGHDTGRGTEALHVGHEQRVGGDEERGSDIHGAMFSPPRASREVVEEQLWTRPGQLVLVDAKRPIPTGESPLLPTLQA
ncbi:MAG: hypothetical protein JWR85_1344 [Marmoricola sp.]|nr:hypothetical protein [Marmoricola sp.]